MSIGQRIKMLRTLKGLSQQQLADSVGVSLSTIQKHESNGWPSRRTQERYLEFFGCDRTWFLTGEGDPYPEGQEKIEVRQQESGEGERSWMMREANQGLKNKTDTLTQAMAGLSEIFYSGDPILVSAIIANIRAFQVAARREQQIRQQADKIAGLERKCEELMRRIQALEGRRKEGIEEVESEKSAVT